MYNLLYRGVLATAAYIALQTWGQCHVSANEAAIVYAFEPACAVIAAYFWLTETMTTRSMIGGALLMGGMIGQPVADHIRCHSDLNCPLATAIFEFPLKVLVRERCWKTMININNYFRSCHLTA